MNGVKTPRVTFHLMSKDDAALKFPDLSCKMSERASLIIPCCTEKAYADCTFVSHIGWSLPGSNSRTTLSLYAKTLVRL